MYDFKHACARVFGNTGMYFVAPYAATHAAGIPNLEVALWSMVIGLILAASREAAAYGRGYNGKK